VPPSESAGLGRIAGHRIVVTVARSLTSTRKSWKARSVALSSRASESPWQLTLPEEFVLVSHAGSPSDVDDHEEAIRAACMFELGLAGKLVAGERPAWLRRRLMGSTTPLGVRDPAPIGDSVLDAVLLEVSAKKVSTRQWLSEAYRQRLIDRSLLLATGKTRVLRRARYEPADAGTVARSYVRLRAALERPEELDVRTVALTVALSHPASRMPLLNAACVIHEQIGSHAALLGQTAPYKKRSEAFMALFKLPEAYRAQVEAQACEQDRASALAVCDVIDAVAETRTKPEGWGGG
jgi:hypothetical protein